MSNIAIKVDHLYKRYDLHKKGAGTLRDTLASAWKHGLSTLSTRESFWALNDVSFEVPHGQVLGIIGRNGAGKSTLLKILSRITPPTKGRVELNGRVASLLEVGTGFHPELTGRENIFLNGAILGMSRMEIRRKFDEIVDFSGVERFLDTPVKHYSSGMYVRLAFAVAAHLEAEILLIDEVLTVGDVEFQRKCLGKMDNIAKTGRAVIVVSHNMAQISKSCHETALIEHGRISIRSNTEKAIESYKDSLKLTQKESIHYFPHLPEKDLSITKVAIKNNRGSLSSTLKYGEPFSITIELTSTIEASRVSGIIGIDTIFGERVFSTVSYQCRKTYSVRRNKKSRIIISFSKILLKPDQYSVYLSIFLGKERRFDTIKIENFFKITEEPFGEDIYEGYWGFLRLDGIWS